MESGSHPVRGALWVGAVLVLFPAGCVTEDQRPEAAGPLQQGAVVIALPTQGNLGGDGPVDTYYRSILGQMYEAYLERNPELLGNLLGRHDDPAAPAWALEALPRYRTLLTALAFELHGESRSRVQSPSVRIGEPVEFLLDLPAHPGMSVELGAEDSEHPVVFRVSFDVVDRDSRGDVIRSQSSRLLHLSEDLLLAGETSLQLPFTLDLPAFSTLIRKVVVRVELMPGYVQVDGDQVPHNRVSLATSELVLYPPGVESIRRAPRVTLFSAMELGDVDHYPHVFLAAHFMSEQYVEEALAALMGWVRLGNQGQQRVAMAALAVLADTKIEVGDRRRWLDWWQRRNKG
jgi:hypothetical protein